MPVKQKTIKKTRLTIAKRNELKRYAYSTMHPTVEKAAMDSAKRLLHEAVKVIHADAFLQDEMDTLRKFGFTRKDVNVKFFITYSKGDKYDERVDVMLDEEVECPMDAGYQYHSRSLGEFDCMSEVGKAVKLYEKKKLTYEKAARKIRYTFDKLIDTAKTYENVLEVWKGAEALRSEIAPPPATTEIAALSGEEVKTIKRLDRASRKDS